MNYAPQTNYRADVYMAEGSRRLSDLLAGYGQDLVKRGRDAAAMRAQLMTMQEGEGGTSNIQQPTSNNQSERDAAGNPVASGELDLAKMEQLGQEANTTRQLLKLRGYSKPALDAMNYDELKGILQGHEVNAAMAAEGMRLKEGMARLKAYDEASAERERQQRDEEAAGRALRAYGEAVGQPGVAGFDPGNTAGLPGVMRSNLESVRGYGGRPAVTEAQAVNRALQEAGGGRASLKALDTLSKYGDLVGGGMTTEAGPFEGTAILRDRRGSVHVVTDPGAKRLEGGEPEEKTLTDGSVVVFNRKTGLYSFAPNQKADATARAQLEVLNARMEAEWYPPNTKFHVENGIVMAVAPDGSKKPVKSMTQAGMNYEVLNPTKAEPEPARLKHVRSQAEYNALKSGTQYIGKDNKTYRKP